LILSKEIVVDQTSGGGAKSERVSAPMRVAAVVPVIGGVGEEETRNDEIHCEICGRRGVLVRFGDGTTERKRGGVVFQPDA